MYVLYVRYLRIIIILCNRDLNKNRYNKMVQYDGEYY